MKNHATKPSITLRPVRLEDEDFLFRVYASTRSEELEQTGWTEEQKQSFLLMQFNAQRQDYTSRFPGAEYSVVLVGGIPAGRLWVHRSDDEIRLLDIALLPGYRNAGTGTELLNRLIAEAKASGSPLRHSVFKLNEGALRFYQRLGFAVIDDLETYYVMEWNLGGTG